MSARDRAVDAAGRALLDGYIATLEASAVSRVSRPEQLAYWINLYNAVALAGSPERQGSVAGQSLECGTVCSEPALRVQRDDVHEDERERGDNRDDKEGTASAADSGRHPWAPAS